MEAASGPGWIPGRPGRYEGQELDAMNLPAAQQAFPDQDFIEVFGGWLAVPKGTPVIRGLNLDSVVSKLRVREDKA